MPRAPKTWPADWTMADLLEHFGGISPRRIRLNPPPGTATEQDVIDIQTHEDRLYELVDGVLVEKVMGFPESTLTCQLIRLLGNYVEEKGLGILAGADGTVRLMPGLVRIPDISFVSWRQLPRHEVPSDPIPDLAPDLAIEVLREGNTRGEMNRKLKDYFLAGVRLVWYVDPRRQTVRVYTAPDRCTRLRMGDTLDGGDVLPGFRLPLRKLFAKVGRPRAARAGKKGKGKS